MGSLGDDDGENKSIRGNLDTDFVHGRTQPFDSLSSPSSLPGEKGEDADEFQFLQSTVPFDDTLPVEDEFETQVINVGGETQLLDEMDGFGSMDDVLIDEFDNHIALDSDGEETDGTEILDDNDELSGYELERQGKCQWSSEDKIQPAHNCNLGKLVITEQLNASTSSNQNSGSVPRFASIRAESLRASGLAAHNNSVSHSLSTSNHLLEEQADKNDALKTKSCDEFDHVRDIGNCDFEVNAFKNENKSKVGSSTARKLFYEDCSVEKVGPSCYDDNTLRGKEVLQSVSCDDGLAGLSYIDSQEPGEASQANALACVQKLIDENKELFDYGINDGKSGKETSNHVSMTKGPQSLAKRSISRTASGKNKIFDWDDEIEDEGGGDIFCRRKEDFFGGGNLGRRCFSIPCNPNGESNVQNKNMIRSDSKLDFHDVDDKEAKESETNIRKNLADEFNEQSNLDRSNGQSEAAITGNNNAETLGVGLDTQIAAEAMEALFYGDLVPNNCTDDVLQAKPVSCKESLKGLPRRKARRGVTRQSKNKSKVCDKSSKQSSLSPEKHSGPVMNEANADLGMTRRKTANVHARGRLTAHGRKIMKEVASEVSDMEKVGGTTEGQQADKIDRLERNTLKKGLSGRKRLAEELVTCTPVARRTRKSLLVSQLRSAENVSDMGEVCEVHSVEKNIVCSVDEAPISLLGNGQSAESVSHKSVEYGNIKPNLTASNGFSCFRRPRSRRRLSVQCNQPHKSDAKLNTSDQAILVGKSASAHNGLQIKDMVNSPDSNRTSKMQSSVASRDFSSIYPNHEGPSPHRIKKAGLDSFCAKNRVDINSDKSPKQATKLSETACSSPIDSVTPANAVSPVCIGNGYFKQSCKKNPGRSNLINELRSLCHAQPEPFCALKDSRKRRDLADIQVLFSHHLDEDIIKQQRKIADRLKVSIASSITEATHFIADNFVRTRNMLEAIASGKPVVTHLWLENVGQANYYIDEQNYIMRDIKKEKEFGFCMPVTLARARQHPLLQGRRVLITPNAKPGKEIISSLVRAVHGQAVARVGRSALKEDIVADDLLVLSCEEDYEVCVPFLEKGAAVYSSELLLNGIVTQRLEYERHRLFADHVKKTRSTLWLKKDGRVFTPVSKVK